MTFRYLKKSSACSRCLVPDGAAERRRSRRNLKRSSYSDIGAVSDRGAVLIEASISLGLLVVVILGGAHLLAKSHRSLLHSKVMTELLMGPQLQTIDFDVENGIFSVLGPATSPTVQQYMDEIGNFFTQRAPDDAVLHLFLGYVEVNSTTGVASQYVLSGSGNTVYTYPSGAPPSRCNNSTLTTNLVNYGLAHLAAYRDYVDPNTSTKPAIGSKLYDVTVGPDQVNDRYREYVNFLPMVYAAICSETFSFLYPDRTVTYYPFVPRRLVN